MNYAYERVSTLKQDTKRQDMILENYKIDLKFEDKASAKNIDRPELTKLKLAVKEGDNIFCESICRLARNVNDLRDITDYFTEKGVTIHFVKEGFNTEGNAHKFLITILGAVAEMERERITERVKEGVKRAQLYGTKSGKPIGRPYAVIPKEFYKYYKKWKAKEIMGTEFAKLLGVSRVQMYRLIKKYEEN